MFKRMSALLLTAAFLCGCTAAGGSREEESTATAAVPMIYRDMAVQATADLLSHFWNTHQNRITNNYTMVWEFGMMVFELETMYDATGDEQYKNYIATQWVAMQRVWNQDTISVPGRSPNDANDDAAWNAMTLMAVWRMTGDTKALQWVYQVIRRAYDYWGDYDRTPSPAGLYYDYRDSAGQNRVDPNAPGAVPGDKSFYAAGLLLSALEYTQASGDNSLLQESLNLHAWMETNLRRDGVKTFGDRTLTANDDLYYIGFNESNPAKPYGPLGGNVLGITEAGSDSGLFGNMAMAAINVLVSQITGDDTWRQHAVETANAIPVSLYNNHGVLLNDRDAWVEAAFVRYWVTDVLTLPGVDPENLSLIADTAQSIMTVARTSDGYYYAEWSGGNGWERKGQTNHTQLMTNANTVHMVAAAALAESMGLIQG
ncbi:MAG: hypothetical protein FWF49_05310 [Oscillospiraceae bacterium]|nr:hypothetical protein [Oscillospiraceae bacterium]